MLRVGLAAAALLTASSAISAEPLTSATQKALWCASAFNWLARDADDAGDAAAAEVLDAWSLRFTERVAAAMQSAGFDEGGVEAAIAHSDATVLEEMQAGVLRHDPATCPEEAAEGR